MPRHNKQSTYELAVFRRFVERINLPINLSTVVKRSPPEPDLLCRHASGGYIAFELSQISDQKGMEKLNHHLKNGDTDSLYIRIGTPTRDGVPIEEENPVVKILEKKLNKDYESKHPMELLLYSELYVLPTMDMVDIVKTRLEDRQIQFRRIWIMGGGGSVQCAYRSIS